MQRTHARRRAWTSSLRGIFARARQIAAHCCPIHRDSKNPYWDDSARALLAALLLYVTDDPQQKKTLGHVRELITMSRNRMEEELFPSLAASEAFDGAIKEQGNIMIGLPHDQKGGVIGSLQTQTEFITDPLLKAATNTSTVRFNQLFDQKKPISIRLRLHPQLRSWSGG